jgi:hypothetical protein
VLAVAASCGIDYVRYETVRKAMVAVIDLYTVGCPLLWMYGSVLKARLGAYVSTARRCLGMQPAAHVAAAL